MRRFLALLALLGFTLSLMVHFTALIGINASKYVPWVWGLHLGMFIVFIPLIIASRMTLGPRPSLAQLREHFPAWVLKLTAAIMAYAILNFILFAVATEGGGTSIKGEKYILENHGQFIRELTASEYEAFKANDLRGASGHWLVFYFTPFVGFMFFKSPKSSGKKSSRDVLGL
jgi:hypothetical protein